MKCSKIIFLVMLICFSFVANTFAAAPGDALMALTAKAIPKYGSADFSRVATDNAGNLYVIGALDTDSPYDFGNGVTVSGGGSGNPVMVKYDKNGTAQWAKSATGSVYTAFFESIVLDSSGNLYVAGSIGETSTYNFGNSVTVSGPSSDGNVLLLKYSSSGEAQWAKTVTTGPAESRFHGLAIDSNDNLYCVGITKGNSSFDFGNSVTVSGTNTGDNILLVKYNTSGEAQWAKSVTSGPGDSIFNSVAIDDVDNIYAVGTIYSDNTYDFGNSKAVSGGYSSSDNVVIVKYDGNGDTQWAKSTTIAPGFNYFASVASNSEGKISVAGYLSGNGTYTFGNGISVNNVIDNNGVLCISYSKTGEAQWAKSVTTAPGGSEFEAINLDNDGYSYAVGQISGNQTYVFGNGVTAAGAADAGSSNTVLVKYDDNGNAQWAKSTSIVTGYGASSNFKGITLDVGGNAYAVGVIRGDNSYGFGNGVVAAGNASMYDPNPVLVKYFAFEPSSGSSNSSSSSSNPPVTSWGSSIVKKKLPLLISIGGTILMFS